MRTCVRIAARTQPLYQSDLLLQREWFMRAHDGVTRDRREQARPMIGAFARRIVGREIVQYARKIEAALLVPRRQ